MIILQADPHMGPALFPEHAVQQQNANPEIDMRLINGAPHVIHSFLGSIQRYVEALHDAIKRGS